VAVPDDVENPQGMESVCTALGAKPIDWGYRPTAAGLRIGERRGTVAAAHVAHRRRRRGAGANCIVTSCPLCQFNVDAYQDKVGEQYGIAKRLPVYFITELAGIAMASPPRRCRWTGTSWTPWGS